jgi:hypothetical protein
MIVLFDTVKVAGRKTAEKWQLFGGTEGLPNG